MVTVDVAPGAELVAVNVRVLAVAVVAALNNALTPDGRPEAARLTLPLKPFSATSDIAVLTLELEATVSALAPEARLKFGVTTVRGNVVVVLTVPDVPGTVPV